MSIENILFVIIAILTTFILTRYHAIKKAHKIELLACERDVEAYKQGYNSGWDEGRKRGYEIATEMFRSKHATEE